ncbi:hypothetical protein [Paraoerskovia marina]|uniref:Uncharacterized protein n=2 Tax=Paraoerskovia marina TaxID=545619 RepID=A0A1H1LZN4_9CELL|nr:hypothetical protein [Paraoerskovia marina]SDR79850.1 hypothetical protein SAMN04489860_0086 [Paraoerskovia marina]
MAGLDEAREAKAALRRELDGCDGVGGIGIAPDSAESPPTAYVVRVLVTDESAAARVPDEVHGVHVRVVLTGTIEAQ